MSMPAPLYGGGYTVDDLEHIDLPGRFELIHGDIVMMPPAKSWHNEVQFLLRSVLTPVAREHGFRAVHEQGAILAEDTDPVPDLMIIDGAAYDHALHSYPAEAVAVVVEIESGNKRKDRIERPADYARAGIPWYWRIENVDDVPVIRAFRLDCGLYEPVGVYGKGDRLDLTEPFEIAFDIADIADITP
ncbi:Uma2 family endonuclease [Actinomadura macrotermitis]|uniref:Putative restriction endonuclease domain-containing protein n=1 Tax=Actinomadura macrotermitis TaxID=2585200 RepID=A0A7K0C7V0_9ACTN|nr:Uma2 family endonuclease [Actinomadura macrotermitis]MQY09513.1 hypothetical protein [Actinomadura macrotermitis]